MEPIRTPRSLWQGCVAWGVALACCCHAFAERPSAELTAVAVQSPPSPQPVDDSVIREAIPPNDDDSAELPASLSGDNELLSLAPGGEAVLPRLPLRSAGCSPRPLLRCGGPDHRGCTRRIYFGTHPCDDDPVLSLSPDIGDHATNHWYQHAKRMVLRKKQLSQRVK